MFRDQKNINVRVVSWLLLAIFTSNMHYLFIFVSWDVMHINYHIPVNLFGNNWVYVIQDFFPFWNAKASQHLDIQWYFFLVGLRFTNIILSYLLLSAIGALSTLMSITVFGMDIYKRVYLLTKIYLFVQLYNLLSYLLVAGQFFHGWPLLFYVVAVILIFFVKKTEGGYVIKAEI